MPMIRDTINPLNEREVPEAEALDLERQGAVLTGTRAKTPEGLRAAAVRQVLEREAATFAATEPVDAAPPADDVDEDEDDDQDDDQDDDASDNETPGDTSGDITDDTQES